MEQAEPDPSFFQAIILQLREREFLRQERLVLETMARKVGAGATTAEDWIAIRERNARRLAELERRKINRVVFSVRAAVLCLPSPVGRPLRAAIRGLVRLPSPPKRALQPPPAVLPLADLPPPSLRDPVAVVMHMFYPDLAAEMRAYLEMIPGPVDIYLSTDTLDKAAALRLAFEGWGAGRVEVRTAPNRGRDIAPKLITFHDVYARHEVVLHLHGKRSPHESTLRVWRYYLLETLVGERVAVTSILSAFEHRPDVGIIAADHYFAVSNRIDWGKNFGLADDLARRMGITLDAARPIDFPSGSMFWARSSALRPLLDLDLQTEDFPPEALQVDGTLAHAVERLYFEVCRTAGYGWLKVRKADFFQ